MKKLKQIQGDGIHIAGMAGDVPRKLKAIGTGGGGSFDYEKLKNKPRIETVELIGDKTFDELGLGPVTIEELLDILQI